MLEYIVVAIWTGITEHSFEESIEDANRARDEFLDRKAYRVVIAKVLES